MKSHETQDLKNMLKFDVQVISCELFRLCLLEVYINKNNFQIAPFELHSVARNFSPLPNDNVFRG